ncbi:MAG: hypothetical protein PHN69_06625 [Candidatus Pacebacteria bacterium]|nr:hypothetical protein [Candidatus Paceibacterota bacterium]
MNIDEFRAIKAQQEEATPPTEQTKPPETENTPTNPPEIPPTEPSKPPESTKETKPTIPDKIKIDGIGEITVDELKNGYLRTQDYTKKTQEVSRKRKENEEAISFYEQVKQNPQLLQQIASGEAPTPHQLNPLQAKVLELEANLYDMKLENEINRLQIKYPDFEVREVLEIAHEKKMLDLEDAYLLSKSAKPSESVNADELKKQLREEILKEIEAEKNTTTTVITPGNSGTVYEENAPKLTEAEKKVASRMFRKAKDPYAEYEKWKNVKT